MTIMGIVAGRDGIPIEGMTAEVQKGMATEPRRIGSLPLVIRVPGTLSADQKKKLEAAARTCPVASSLREDIEATMSFEYPDE